MKKNIILQDPTTFSVFDITINKIPRRIVVIGEIHDIITCKAIHDKNKNQPIILSDFIKKYHESIGKDKILDIFSESFYIGEKKLGWLPSFYYLVSKTTSLDDTKSLPFIRKRLDACSPKYNFSFYECPENLRVHLCDVRFIKQMDYSLKKDNPQECIVNKLFKIGISYIYPEKVPKVSSAICDLTTFVRKFLFDNRSEEYHVKISEYIIKETKIYKQIENIPSQMVRKKLTKWSHKYYDKHITNARKKFLEFEKIYGKEIRSCYTTEYVSNSCTKAFLQEISLPILHVISVFMDMYLIARLFRNFADDTYVADSIVYVGEYHAKNYRELMKNIGAKEIFHKSSIKHNSYHSCVDITKFYNTYMEKKKKKTK